MVGIKVCFGEVEHVTRKRYRFRWQRMVRKMFVLILLLQKAFDSALKLLEASHTCERHTPRGLVRVGTENDWCTLNSERPQSDDVDALTAGKNVIAKNYIGMGTSAIQRRLMCIIKFPMVILLFPGL